MTLTVGKKIGLGFGAMMALLLLVGLVGLGALRSASNGFAEYRGLARDTNLAGRLQANMLMAEMNVYEFLATSSDAHRQEYEEYLKRTEGFLEEADREIQAPERAALIDQITREVSEYQNGFAAVGQYMDRRHTLVHEHLNPGGLSMEQDLTEIMSTANDDGDLAAAFHAGTALRNLLLARLYVTKFLDENKQENVNRVYREFADFDEEMTTLDEKVENVNRRRLLDSVKETKAEYTKSFDELVSVIQARNEVIEGTLDRIGPAIAKDVEDVKLSVKADQDELGPALQRANSTAINLIAIVGAIAMAVGLFLSITIARGITRALSQIIRGLSDSSEQVSSAASQVASASQTLAEGSSEQAAAVEETGSSVEEMSSMVNQNATHAGETEGLMKVTSQNVTQGRESMNRLGSAIDSIKASSDETAKIVKTIDEIAFQTNLLALNAAVEAARAGEAGKGFAVVAEEVRNLAQRSAEAAKSTSNLIEESLKNAEGGVAASEETRKVFDDVSENTSQVSQLVAQVAAASNEQAQGIEQISSAIEQMDQVTQSNAANAEESASAAEELSAQSQELDRMVRELRTLVGGTEAVARGGGGTGSRLLHAAEQHVTPRFLAKNRPSRVEEPVSPSPEPTEPEGENIIPFDDKEVANF